MRGSEYAQLRAFASIVEHGSFARAAAHLRVSPSALSQTIRGLEERLGMRLLNRTTRSVALSAAGARLMARLGPALEELDGALADASVAPDRPAGLLRINSSRIAAVQFVAPMLGGFHRAFPDITLDLVADDRITDIVAERFDAGIRLGERLERDMVGVKLTGDLEMMTVATPAYLAARGVPRSPRELSGHVCINMRMPTSGSLYRWEFERGRKTMEVAVEGPLIVNDSDVALAAALGGVGIAYLFDYQVRASLESGELVRVLAQWTPPFTGFYLYHPGRRHMPATLRAFIDFIRAEQKR
jgi:DNA-binding transcriptional LysR family regulator